MPDWPSWDDWLATLDDSTRHRALALRGRFRSLGVPNPEGWARSEVTEDIAQLASLLFLRAVWARVDHWAGPGGVEAIEGNEALLSGGIDIAQLRTFARRVAYETALEIVVALDRIDPDDLVEPGWVLMEADEDGAPTHRDLLGLHEIFHDADPSGRGDSDLLPRDPGK